MAGWLPNQFIKCLAGADQLRRPDDGMEGDIIFADKVIGSRVRVVPPLAPGILICR